MHGSWTDKLHVKHGLNFHAKKCMMKTDLHNPTYYHNLVSYVLAKSVQCVLLYEHSYDKNSDKFIFIIEVYLFMCGCGHRLSQSLLTYMTHVFSVVEFCIYVKMYCRLWRMLEAYWANNLFQRSGETAVEKNCSPQLLKHSVPEKPVSNSGLLKFCQYISLKYQNPLLMPQHLDHRQVYKIPP